MKWSAAICVLAFAPILAGQSHTGVKAKKPAQKKPPVVAPKVEEPAPVPEPPPRPAQKPPVPPKVSLTNGMVTVLAENSTLTDVLKGIEKVSGVKFDSGGIVSQERVAAQIGPAPVREVIYSLLQGSRYDFVILSSFKDPAVVERVLLTPRIAGTSQPGAANAPKPSQPVQEIEPVDVMDSGEGNEGFAPPAVSTPSPPPSSQPPADIKTPEQLQQQQEDQRNNPRNPPGGREVRPERPR